MYLLEREPKDLVELTTWAQHYLIAHRQQLGGKTKSTVRLKRAEQRKPTQCKLDTTQGRQRSLQCYRCQGYGHRQSECPTKVSPGKDQKSSMAVGHSNQKKTRAMMARSHEDGEEAFTCVNVERPRSSGNSKKSNLNRLTSNDKAIYIVLLAVPRVMMVKSTLEQASCGDTRQFRLAADGRPHSDRCSLG